MLNGCEAHTWIELPTATPSARSILFFMATMTAVMCSHAFPAMGSTCDDEYKCSR
jgi:hypothetical protein